MTAGEQTHGALGHADVLDGPFTTRQLLRLDQALRVADHIKSTELRLAPTARIEQTV